jgi:AAA family ATP:ADP antiporter
LSQEVAWFRRNAGRAGGGSGAIVLPRAMSIRRRLGARFGHEAAVVVWAAATFACLLAATFVLRPVRDALALDGDPDFIPVLFTATFVAMLVLAPAWGWLVGRFDRRRFVAVALHATTATVLGFLALVASEADPAAVGRVFYVWSAVTNVFVVSVFWSVLADVLGPDTARRLYGPIAVGGTAGALLGPLVARLLAGAFGVAGVLVAAAALFQLAALGLVGLDRAARRLGDTPAAASVEPVAGASLDGLRDVVRSRYLAGVALYVVCVATAGTFVYLEQADLVHAALPDRDARTELFATIDLFTQGATLVLQALVAAPLIGWLGAGAVLAILPVIQGAGLVALLAAPTVGTLIAVQIASRATQHGLMRPARELLFTVVARAEKYRAKSVIDTLIFRFGDVSSSWLHFGLVVAGLAGAGVLVVTLQVTALWIATAVFLGAGFRRRAAAKPAA